MAVDPPAAAEPEATEPEEEKAPLPVRRAVQAEYQHSQQHSIHLTFGPRTDEGFIGFPTYSEICDSLAALKGKVPEDAQVHLIGRHEAEVSWTEQHSQVLIEPEPGVPPEPAPA